MHTFGSVKLRLRSRKSCTVRLLWKKIIQNMLRIWHDSVLKFSITAICKITQGWKTTSIPILKSTVGASFTPGDKIVARKQKKVKFLSTSAINYLHSSVKPLLVLCKVFMTCKPIRVAQLANKLAFLVCVAKIVRQTTDIFEALHLTRSFRIHCCFLKNLIEPFSK